MVFNDKKILRFVVKLGNMGVAEEVESKHVGEDIFFGGGELVGMSYFG